MVSLAFSLPAADRPAPLSLVAEGAVTLRVSGGKPLRFAGHLLAEGSSRTQASAAWHELALYARDGGGIAVAIRSRKTAAGEGDVCRAQLFPGLEDAIAWIEAFDPTADLTVELDAADRRVSGAEIALRAAALRQQTDEITRRWRAMTGELLFQLDAGG